MLPMLSSDAYKLVPTFAQTFPQRVTYPQYYPQSISGCTNFSTNSKCGFREYLLIKDCKQMAYSVFVILKNLLYKLSDTNCGCKSHEFSS